MFTKIFKALLSTFFSEQLYEIIVISKTFVSYEINCNLLINRMILFI